MSDFRPEGTPRFAARFQEYSKALSAFVIILGVAVLCGWVFEVRRLTTVWSTFASMKFNAALLFVCLGAALWVSRDDKRIHARRILALVVIITAGLTLAEYIFGISLGIDQIFVRDQSLDIAYPGRMSIVTSICFLLTALSVLALDIGRARVLQRSAVALSFALALVGLCGYLYGVKSLYSITAFSTFALHTSVGFLAASLAYFFARPNEGMMTIAASDNHAGLILRTVLPTVISVPIVLAWLMFEGERNRLYGVEFGVALLILGNIGCLAASVILIVRSLDRAERAHESAEQAQRASELHLKGIIDSATDAIITVNNEQKIVLFIAAAEKMFGCSAREAIERSIDRFIPGRFRAVHREDIRRFGNTNVTTRSMGGMDQLFGLRANGEEFPIEVSISQTGTDAGKVSTAIIRDVTERKQFEKSLLWRLEFEGLLSDLSRTFINLAGEDIDANMVQSLARIGKFLQLDRIALYEFSPDRTELVLSYCWDAPGVGEPPASVATADLPWWADQVFRGEEALSSHPDDLPEQASAEKEFFRKRGIVSAASIPLKVGGEINGVISFITMKRQVRWTSDLVNQLRVIADILWNALRRKRGMEALRASQAGVRSAEERFRLAMNNIPSGVYTLDLQGLVTYMNPAAEAMFGWTNEELLGKKMHDVTHYKHPDGTPYPASECPGMQVLQTGTELHEHEDQYIRKDGSFFPVVFSTSPLKKDDEAIGIVFGFRDDTLRREAGRAIRESEERFRLVANAAPVMIWMSGLDKSCSYFNQTWLEFTGRPLEAELGNGWAEGVHPEDLEQCMDLYTTAFDRRETFQMQYRLRRHDGEYRWVFDRGVPRFNADGSFAGYIGSVIDVTELRLAEEALRQKDRELLEAQRLAGLGSWQLDVRNDIVTWSEELYRIMGLDPAVPAPSYEEHSSLFGAESWERLSRAVDEALRTGTPYELDLEVVRPDGTTRWLTARGEAVGDATGRIVHLRGTAQDITERRLADETLAGMSGKLLEAQEQERTRIARELHDDICQRVAIIALNLKQVEIDLPTGRVQLRKRVASECKQISVLATDIQELSHRLHSSKLEYLGLEAAAMGFCAEMAKLKNVEIDFHADDVPQALSTEGSLSLFRVLQEALQNGVKHSGSKKFQVAIHCSWNEVELKVRDWGSGFVLEAAAKSWGLGLTSMRERLKLVGGTLSIESQPGAGTTVCARAPLYAATKSPKVLTVGRGS